MLCELSRRTEHGLRRCAGKGRRVRDDRKHRDVTLSRIVDLDICKVDASVKCCRGISK